MSDFARPVVQHLETVARSARSELSSLAQLVRRNATECKDVVDFEALSLSAAYLAFRTVCPTPDAPDAATSFDWVANHRTLVKYTKLHLQRDIQGKETSYGDFRQRNRTRKHGAQLDGYQWSPWAFGGASTSELRGLSRDGTELPTSRVGQGDVLCEYLREAEPEVREQEAQMQRLLEEVRKHLTDREAYLVIEHYWNERSQVELGEEAWRVDPRYRDEAGPGKAITAIGVIMHRARKKLATKLGGHWAVLAKDIA